MGVLVCVLCVIVCMSRANKVFHVPWLRHMHHMSLLPILAYMHACMHALVMPVGCLPTRKPALPPIPILADDDDDDDEKPAGLEERRQKWRRVMKYRRRM